MSISFYAAALIGCDVTSKITLVREVRACAHEVPEGHKHCIDCGKPRMKRERVVVAELDEYKVLKKAGLGVIADDSDQEQLFAGIYVQAREHSGPCHRTVDFETVRAQVKAALEPIGWWDEDLFGLWAVPYVRH